MAMAEPSWPPKSPRDALLSSPSGRKRYQEALESRRLANLSPIKRSATTPNLSRFSSRCADNDTDEEDEETLQLKLEAIEAKLKLKKLQQQRAKEIGSHGNTEIHAGARPVSAASVRDGSVTSRPPSRYQEERDRLLPRSMGNNEVQIPLSPSKRLPATAAKSPRRVLGKDRRAADVSLSRAPSLKSRSRADDAFITSRSGSLRIPNRSPERTITTKKSFSERMAESRSEEKTRQEMIDDRQRNRSTAFNVERSQLERFQSTAQELDTRISTEKGFTREEVVRAVNQNQGTSLRRSNTTGRINRAREEISILTASSRPHSRLSRDQDGDQSSSSQVAISAREAPTADDILVEDLPSHSSDASFFEPFSSLHLSKRILPHTFLSRTLEDKKTMRIPEVLRTVTAPSYDPPDTPGDYVVVGVVASKSAPREQKNNGSKVYDHSARSPKANDDANARNKFIVMTLTDLKWELELFLFSTAFNRYYKLTPGTVVAILNPNILPPPPAKKDTNRFSLSLSSSEDTVLEIGTAKDLGFCKAVRKDGKVCESWIDSRHTEFCAFHVDLQFQKTKSGRMEVNSSISLFGPGGRRGGGGGGETNRSKMTPDDPPKRQYSNVQKDGGRYDKATGTSYFVTPSVPRQTTSSHDKTTNFDEEFDDDDGFLGGNLRRGDKSERLRRRLAEHERERDIARRLGGGGGLGAEYMRFREGHASLPGTLNSASGKDPNEAAGTTRSLSGLDMKRKADIVKLSPLKKTRFVTPKGIREAGRESFGGPDPRIEEEDDGLDII